MRNPPRTLVRAIWLAATASTAMPLADAAAQAPAGASGQAQAPAGVPAGARPWMNAALPADRRVALLLPQMTRAEKRVLVQGFFATDFPPKQFTAPAGARNGSAGYVPGVPRLGIPPQWQSDAGIGVASQGGAPRKRERTALPSNIAIAATWDRAIAERGGAMIGAEARASGFNVLLAGGVNLAREPRNGRNFEYGGEDPLLAGTMVGAQIAGIQSNHIVSTIKHYAINDQETDRNAGNSIIDPAQARMSDLLAFQFTIERADPGSVMCSYNRVNGPFACESPWLLDEVLRRDWKWPGYVMSDWGATHSTVPAISAGLDQQSGYPFDEQPYYSANLDAALANGTVKDAQLDQMAGRILHAMFAKGLFDHPITAAPMDLPDAMLADHARVTQAAAEASMVLLRNQGAILPLSRATKRIVVIGGHADKGVLAGGGSSLVYPKGGNAVPGLEPTIWPGPVMYYPSSPLEAIKRQAPGAEVTFVNGSDPAAAAAAARGADVAIVFATQWAGESFDVALELPDGQDALIAGVAAANPRTVVVLESGAAVLTPWRNRVAGLIAAWYPGTAGGAAIADVLFGRTNPSGHLPVTFPDAVAQLPHPGEPAKGDVTYSEGAAVGYKWFERSGRKPAYAFGHGLSYTSFAMNGLRAVPAGQGARADFTVRNTGTVAGKAVPQVYVAGAGWEAPKRLGGFASVMLAPGEVRSIGVTIDPRLFATFDEATRRWTIAGGSYRVMLGSASDAIVQTATVTLPKQELPAGWRP
ncbi:beta-glucosidase [uncultured Sphingomonas sp.]|uniref:beta-glucosidase n=1 Tax=uncultured Sphingomonas sp. TaxID=158754 RepID=UPI00260EAA9B|nr:beta-glucosidase [uncultured Sphingomonas sp.]